MVVAEIETATATATATCNNNNKKMSLKDARCVLEQRGFKIVVDPNDNIINIENGNGNNNNNNNNCDALVGYHSKCVSFLSYKMDTIVFVFQIKNGESLTVNRINDDLENYIVQKQHDIYDSMNGLSNTCPPQGCSRLTMIIVVYYTSTVDADAMEKVLSIPARKWCNTIFLAVQDENCVSSFMVHTTPMWGRTYYVQLRYWAGLLTGRPQLDISLSHQTIYQNCCDVCFLIILVIVLYSGDTITKFSLAACTILVVQIGIFMWLYQQYQRRRRQRHSSINNCNERSPNKERLL